jgi:hypothetical protein
MCFSPGDGLPVISRTPPNGCSLRAALLLKNFPQIVIAYGNDLSRFINSLVELFVEVLKIFFIFFIA